VLGQLLGQYQIIEEIGKGGMGVVYRARDTRLERDVALKLLPAGTLADADARKRFRNEALALARLNHSNICSVYDFNTQDGIDFLAMEFVPGISLDKRLSSASIPLSEVVHLGVQLADGLASAHAQGVLHRDLKPGNLRITPDGRLKILDFGLAKLFRPDASAEATLSLAETSSFSGTIPYMPPEQLRGEPCDARSDIYSAGSVLYEMATGQRPFPEPQLAKLIDAILHGDAPRSSQVNRRISPALDAILAKALDRSPDRRYQSARELRIDLQRSATTPDAKIAPARFVPVSRLFLAILVLLLTVGASLGWYFSRKTPHIIDTEEDPGSAAARIARLHQRRSVAVLGFKNLSSRPEDAWLSTALSEMLTTELSGGERLRTVSGENVARMKINLSLSDSESYAPDTLGHIRTQLDSDVVVIGSYFVVHDPKGAQIRLDLRLQDTRTGEVLDAFKEPGPTSEILDIVSRAGTRLRTALGAPDLSPEDSGRFRASVPTTPEATRLYAEGLEKFRVYDYVAARDLLQKAVNADPANALATMALASAWGQLGYDDRARELAKKAFDLSSGLPREQQLAVQAQYKSTIHDWNGAIEAYRSLIKLFPDVEEYPLQLSQALNSAGKSQDALSLLRQTRAAFPSAPDDPRFDLGEASISDDQSNYKAEQPAAARAADKARQRGERLILARALIMESWAIFNLGDPEKAITMSLESKGIYESVGDRVGVSRALHNLGTFSMQLGKFDDAQKYFEQTIAIRTAIQDNRGLARVYNDATLLKERRGDLKGALEGYKQGLSIAQKINDKNSIANSFGNLANIYQAMGQNAEAMKLYQQALDMDRAMGNKGGTAVALANLGMLQTSSGNFNVAKQTLEESARDFEEIGRPSGVAQVRSALGNLYSNQGDYVSARKNYQQSLDIAKTGGDPATAASAEISLGIMDRHDGEFASARKSMEEALSFARQSGDALLIADASRNLAYLNYIQGDLAECGKIIDAILPEIRKGNDKNMLAIVLDAQADLLVARDDVPGALKAVNEALALAKELKDTWQSVVFDLDIARYHLEQGDPRKAGVFARNVLSAAEHQKNIEMQGEALIVLARAVREQGQIAEAQNLIQRAAEIPMQSGWFEMRLWIATEQARILTATGGAKEAAKNLTDALAAVGPKTAFATQFDARLALAEASAKAGAPDAQQAFSNLEKEATTKGFLLVARKAAAKSHSK
jgi:serine/threonine protein kinase/tetratricopeptide (TPR) repeat protein